MLTTLFDEATGPALPLPAELVTRYGGGLRFPAGEHRPYVFANFVSTIDGVVSFALPGKARAALISKREPADRFMLGFCRAIADAVIVGAGTLRVEGSHAYTPEGPFADAAAAFADLRRAMGKRKPPLPVFVTASGDVDLTGKAFSSGDALVLTTPAGAARIGAALPGVRVRAIGDGGAPTAREIVGATVAECGGDVLLTEGGPSLLGRFVREGALDELFLTVAPQIAGRSAEERRPAFVEGAALSPDEAPWGRLVSAKRARDFLFLRFAFEAKVTRT